jgi:hypothetical protein
MCQRISICVLPRQVVANGLRMALFRMYFIFYMSVCEKQCQQNSLQ